MRNTKIALAVLALVASTAAMADGATVYGVVDAGVSQVDGGKTTFGGAGNWAGNILGISASEDLEGGMKASVNFELGYDLGTGNNGANGGISQSAAANPNGNPFFNRKANVSLAGEFGTVTAGLQFSPFIGAAIGGSALTNNQSFYVTSLVLAGSGVAGSSGLGATPVASGFFIPNAVSYSTPNMGGFSATVLGQVTGSTSNTNDTNDNKYTAYAGHYHAGDIGVHAGYQKRDGNFTAGTATAPGANYSSMTVSGSYAMGATTLGAGYISHDLNTSATASTKVNVIYGLVAQKVSDSLIASLGYAQNNATTKASMLNVGLQYNLNSKGTTHLYFTGGQGNKTAVGPIYGGTAGDATTTTKGYAVGIVKGF
jgi:predicted porin